MALSDYDLLAFDSEGKPCNGTLKNHIGAIAEIYKNWVYIMDPKGWHDRNGYCNNVVAELHEGDLKISWFEVEATRGPQESIFCLVRSYDHENKVYYRMAGIGCCGYDERLEEMMSYLGLDLKDYPEDEYTITEGSSYANGTSHRFLCIHSEEGYEDYKLPGGKFEPEWVGVKPSTYSEFMSWLESKINRYNDSETEWLDKIKKSTPVRANQGDMFFANSLDIIPQTEPGKQEEPVLNKLIAKK